MIQTPSCCVDFRNETDAEAGGTQFSSGGGGGGVWASLPCSEQLEEQACRAVAEWSEVNGLHQGPAQRAGPLPLEPGEEREEGKKHQGTKRSESIEEGELLGGGQINAHPIDAWD